MFKKISHILFALIILITSVGVTVSKHYCGSTLKSVSVIVAPEPCCEIPDGCCHDESITIKMENDFSVTSFFVDFTQLALELPAMVELIQDEYSGFEPITRFIHKPPPLTTQTVLSYLQSYLL
ncbi:MAG: hypothetical protein HQ521_18400 [Bacteroidetes bacterium]|nr:hypothetical protein [Bacteroidota bacterium]